MTNIRKTTGSRYTDEQTQDLVKAYTSALDSPTSRDAVVAKFAKDYGFPEGSIRAKLSCEGVYIAKARLTKSGDPIVRKSALVATIAGLMGKSEEAVGSLEKVTKPVLVDIVKALTK